MNGETLFNWAFGIVIVLFVAGLVVGLWRTVLEGLI